MIQKISNKIQKFTISSPDQYILDICISLAYVELMKIRISVQNVQKQFARISWHDF